MEDTALHTYCHNHPTVETSLRCNQCGEYICANCAVHTPTGYRCKQCIRQQQKVYDTSHAMDPVFAVAVAGVLSFLGSLLVSVLGYFTLFLAPLAGIVIGEAVRLVTGKRRSKTLFRMVLIATVVGGLPLLVYRFFIMLAGLGGGLGGFYSIFNVLWYVYYLVTATTTAYYRVSGQTLRFRK